jgi:hypothetical protein
MRQLSTDPSGRMEWKRPTPAPATPASVAASLGMSVQLFDTSNMAGEARLERLNCHAKVRCMYGPPKNLANSRRRESSAKVKISVCA